MKVLILLSGRFPTEKAYGVTTTGTIKSLIKFGHDVHVFALSSEYEDGSIPSPFYSQHLYKENILTSSLKRYSFAGLSVSHKIAWKLFWLITLKLNSREINMINADILWTRDGFGLEVNSRGARCLIELHNLPSAKITRLLKNRNRSQKYTFAPISKSLNFSLVTLNSNANVVLAPMGIDDQNLQSKESISRYVSRITAMKISEPIRVGYVGKFAPNGYSKGIEDLLKFAEWGKELGRPYNISIVGGTPTEVLNLESQLKKYSLQRLDVMISGHLIHSDALKVLADFDVIVLPKPASETYLGFPLKAIESIATGRIVIVADCKIYRDIFCGQFEPFWYSPGNPESMDIAITSAVTNSNLEVKLLAGIDFAADFTWERRTKRILERLSTMP